MGVRADVIQGSFPHGLNAISGRRESNAVQLPPHVSAPPPLPGVPLRSDVRQMMEALFRANFADVRVHTGGEAARLGATAFTRGTEIHFAPNTYNPATSHGRGLLAHELTHVVQQRSGRVRNPFGGGVAVVHNPVFEAEAEQMRLRASSAIVQRLPSNNNDPTANADGLYEDRKKMITVNGQNVPRRITFYMKSPPRGTVPSVSPPGWTWLQSKVGRLKGRWVRFHIVNQELGGPGHEKWNLIPATTLVNCQYLNQFEKAVKGSAITNDEWTYIDVRLSYDQTWPAPIPNDIQAEWGVWDANTQQWQMRSNNVRLQQDISHLIGSHAAYMRGWSISLEQMAKRGVPHKHRQSFRNFLVHYSVKVPTWKQDSMDWGVSKIGQTAEKEYGDDFDYEWVKDIWLDDDPQKPNYRQAVVKAL